LFHAFYKVMAYNYPSAPLYGNPLARLDRSTHHIRGPYVDPAHEYNGKKISERSPVRTATLAQQLLPPPLAAA
jgi:hypothetical protein